MFVGGEGRIIIEKGGEKGRTRGSQNESNRIYAEAGDEQFILVIIKTS